MILCTGNSARSHMSEGLLRHEGGAGFDVYSAATRPSAVRDEAVEARRECGIDISRQRSKAVDEFAGQPFDYVITVCDNAKESCAVFPPRPSAFTGALRTRPPLPAMSPNGLWHFARCGIRSASACASS